MSGNLSLLYHTHTAASLWAVLEGGNFALHFCLARFVIPAALLLFVLLLLNMCLS